MNIKERIRMKGGEKLKRFLSLLWKAIPVISAITIIFSAKILDAIDVLALTTADVTVTATPEYLAITNSEGSWTIGAVAESATKWWTAAGTAPSEPALEAEMKSAATNTGSIASNIGVHSHDPSGGVGWTLVDDAVGEDEVILGIGKTGSANKAAMLKLVDTTPQELSHELAAAGHIDWCMYLDTGTFTDGDEKSWTVTLTISKHT